MISRRIFPLDCIALVLCWIPVFPGLAFSSQGIHHDMLVTTEWLAENLDRSNLVLVHVSKNPENYAVGHIPGARLLEWKQFVSERGPVSNEIPPLDDLIRVVRGLGIEKDSRIVLYDDEEGGAAARAFLTLESVGLGETSALLDGQLKKWKAEDRPLSTAKPSFAPSQFVPEARRNVIVSLDEVKKIVSASKEKAEGTTALVDARSPAEFSGKEAGEGVKRPGHIPGAANIPWASHIVDAENPVLRQPNEILNLYSELGISPQDRVISYCRTGRTSSMSYFTLKYLGFDVRLFDGSFSEWSAEPEAPVETSEVSP